MRLCSGTYNFDNDYEALVSTWHSACDSHDATESFTPTTPPLSTLSTTVNVEVCSALHSSCVNAYDAFGSCTSSYSLDPDKALSCACQTPLLSLASACAYDVNVTCLLTTAELTNIDLFTSCGVCLNSSHPAESVCRWISLTNREPHWCVQAMYSNGSVVSYGTTSATPGGTGSPASLTIASSFTVTIPTNTATPASSPTHSNGVGTPSAGHTTNPAVKNVLYAWHVVLEGALLSCVLAAL